MPAVTIITVTYNAASTLADTFASIQSQDGVRVQHVLVDGGSTDGTQELIKSYAMQYPDVTWVSEEDEGLYDAMNKGIAMASQDVIGILNSDDIYHDNKVLRDVLEQFKVGDCDASYGDLVYVGHDDTSAVTRTWVAGRGNVRRGWCAPHPTLFVHRRLYDELGDYRIDFKIASDYHFMLRLLTRQPPAKLAYIPRVLVRMRMGGASSTDLHSNFISWREARVSLGDVSLGPVWLVNTLRLVRKLRQLHGPRRH